MLYSARQVLTESLSSTRRDYLRGPLRPFCTLYFNWSEEQWELFRNIHRLPGWNAESFLIKRQHASRSFFLQPAPNAILSLQRYYTRFKCKKEAASIETPYICLFYAPRCVLTRAADLFILLCWKQGTCTFIHLWLFVYSAYGAQSVICFMPGDGLSKTLDCVPCCIVLCLQFVLYFHVKQT